MSTTYVIGIVVVAALVLLARVDWLRRAWQNRPRNLHRG